MATPSGVGLDIGTSAVKVVELKRNRSGMELIHYASQPMPAGAIRNGIISQPEAVVEILRNVMRTGHISAKEVYVAVAGQGVVVRQVLFPLMSEDELREAIQWEAEKHLPYSPDDAVVDFHIIGPSADSEGQMEVMLVAAQNDLVNSHVAVLEAAGLTPLAMDVQPFALLRGLELEKVARDRCSGIIDIGAGTTDVVIFKGENLKFTRIIPVAGQRFTETVAEGFKCSFAEADSLKQQHVRVFFGDEPELADGQNVSARLYKALRPVLEEMILEIRRSVDYFRLQNRGDNIEELVLTGGGSRFGGFERLLSTELGIPVRVGNPLEHITVNHRQFNLANLQTIAPTLAVGVGLAQRGAEEA